MKGKVDSMARKRKYIGIDEFRNGYRYRFTVNGKRYTVTGKSPDECKNKETKKRQEIEAGLYKSGREQTLSEYGESWLENKRDTVKETTLRTNRILLSMIVKETIDKNGTQQFGTLKLKDIETNTVRLVQAGLKQHSSTRTTNDCISLLRSVLTSAMNERIITWNPAAGIKPLKRTEERARDNIHRALTKAETGAFMAIARERNSMYMNLYTFLLNTGCRIGEASALTIWDIRNNSVCISRTVTRTENGGYRIGEDTKTAAGHRTIPLTEDARNAVNAQREMNNSLYGEVESSQKPIFRPIRGSILKSSCVNEDIARVCAAAGIERFTVHAFRDTFATRCVESGMQPKTLQEIMGHTDINMTMALYAHAMEDTKIEQLKAVNFG